MDAITDFSIGITVIMEHCYFQAELSRLGVTETIAELDADLTRIGLDVGDTQSRITAVMKNALEVSTLFSHGEITQEDAVMAIACGFMYAYVKEQGADRLGLLRGLIGCLADNIVYLNPCIDDSSYTSMVPTVREQAEDMLGFDSDEMIDCTPQRPTIH